MKVLAEQIVELATARAAEAEISSGITFGVWSQRQAAKPIWDALAQLDPNDPDHVLTITDRAISLCLGNLLGQRSRDQDLVDNPVTSVMLSGSADGARLVLADVLYLYGEFERGIPGSAVQAALHSADDRAAKVKQTQQGDLAEYQASTSPAAGTGD